jgi:CRP-like cAMP-binding protein
VSRAKPLPAVNCLLAALPRADARRFQANSSLVVLTFGEVLSDIGQPIRHVYFPTSSLISQVISVAGNSSFEIGLIGDEGMLGISLALGIGVSPLGAVVQATGSSLRMDSASFRGELERSPALRRVLNRYLHVLMGQFAQAAACTRFHVVEARLARLLLMTSDRTHSDTFHVTHEVLGHMLGVRRVGVTKAATSLQGLELIRYRRGNIEILDRRGLEAASCTCYAIDTASYARMFK